MSPITHFLGSWLIACTTTKNSRDRKLVTVAGVLPDADGLGVIADIVGSAFCGTENTFHYYQQYHHYLLHGWAGAIGTSLVLACFARRRWLVMFLCMAVFHLHLVCDLLGSRGPSAGDLWPIAYGEPFYRRPVFFWKSQWRLDGWQNRIVCITLFLAEIWHAPHRGYSCVQFFNRNADAVVVSVLRKWRTQLLSKKLDARHHNFLG